MTRAERARWAWMLVWLHERADHHMAMADRYYEEAAELRRRVITSSDWEEIRALPYRYEEAMQLAQQHYSWAIGLRTEADELQQVLNRPRARR